MSKEKIAFDYSTVRSKDDDGRLKVELANISKANVCPYYGREIPHSEELGLIPDKVYNLLRDPNELMMGADSSNGIQLMMDHVIVSPDQPAQRSVVGSVGTDAIFEPPYLKNSLVVWVQDAIDLIESGKKKQLSCAYRYKADMTPGFYQGVAYDGVMREISFNHVALVAEGRAGSDVIVSDSMPSDLTIKDINMTNKLAVDAFEKKDDEDDKKAEDDMDMEDMSGDSEMDDDKAKDKKAKDKKAKDAKAAKDKAAKDKAAKDCDAEDEKDESDMKDKSDKKAEDVAPIGITKRAMDAAMAVQAREIENRMRSNAKALREAEDLVRPFIGNLLAQDSAEDVYALYFKSEDVDVTDVPVDAYKALAQQVVKYSSKSKATKVIAIDHSAAKSFETRWPNAARIRNI